MASEPPDSSQPGTTLRTVDELFARPQCTHIITLNNPSQNLHLKRTPEGFRLTFPSPGAQQHPSREFSRLEDMCQDTALMRYGLRDAIWQAISEYPAFPYDVLFRPLGGPVELHILQDSEHLIPHGPHVVYGPVDISQPTPHTYLVRATGGWLVVEHPAFILHGQGRGGRAILRPTRNILDRLRLNVDNFRLRHEMRTWTCIRPGVTVVFGKPPVDWQTVRQLFPSDQPVPPA